MKKIEAEFDQKLAACHHPGNAACNSEAVNTKASKLKAANATLRLCNRTASDARASSKPTTGETVPPLPASSDEFHSTEGSGAACQRCMPTQGTDHASGGGELEGVYGTEFGPFKPAAEINNTIFQAGEGARGIVSAEGHYFNIVRHGGDVLLLDGQLGRQVSWGEYQRMGLHNFQLMRTN